jgi:hypothetical protein
MPNPKFNKTSEWIVFVCGFIPLVGMVDTLLFRATRTIRKMRSGPIHSSYTNNTFRIVMEYSNVMLLMLSLAATIFWIVGVLYGYTTYGRVFKLTVISTVCFILGACTLGAITVLCPTAFD